MLLNCKVAEQFKSMWPDSALLSHKTWSTLLQVMAWGLMAPSITWSNVGKASARSFGIHLRRILHEISILHMSLKITNLRLQLYFPGFNEFRKSFKVIYHFQLNSITMCGPIYSSWCPLSMCLNGLWLSCMMFSTSCKHIETHIHPRLIYFS